MSIGSKKYWFNRFSVFAVLWCLILFFGVGFAGESESKPIEIISAEKVDHDSLIFIGYVKGKSLKTGILRQSGYNDALDRLLDNAQKIGADYVVLDDNSDPKYFVTSIIVRGKAYKKPNIH